MDNTPDQSADLGWQDKSTISSSPSIRSTTDSEYSSDVSDVSDVGSTYGATRPFTTLSSTSKRSKKARRSLQNPASLSATVQIFSDRIMAIATDTELNFEQKFQRAHTENMTLVATLTDTRDGYYQLWNDINVRNIDRSHVSRLKHKLHKARKELSEALQRIEAQGIVIDELKSSNSRIFDELREKEAAYYQLQNDICALYEASEEERAHLIIAYNGSKAEVSRLEKALKTTEEQLDHAEQVLSGVAGFMEMALYHQKKLALEVGFMLPRLNHPLSPHVMHQADVFQQSGPIQHTNASGLSNPSQSTRVNDWFTSGPSFQQHGSPSLLSLPRADTSTGADDFATDEFVSSYERAEDIFRKDSLTTSPDLHPADLLYGENTQPKVGGVKQDDFPPQFTHTESISASVDEIKLMDEAQSPQIPSDSVNFDESRIADDHRSPQTIPDPVSMDETEVKAESESLPVKVEAEKGWPQATTKPLTLENPQSPLAVRFSADMHEIKLRHNSESPHTPSDIVTIHGVKIVDGSELPQASSGSIFMDEKKLMDNLELSQAPLVGQTRARRNPLSGRDEKLHGNDAASEKLNRTESDLGKQNSNLDATHELTQRASGNDRLTPAVSESFFDVEPQPSIQDSALGNQCSSSWGSTPSPPSLTSDSSTSDTSNTNYRISNGKISPERPVRDGTVRQGNIDKPNFSHEANVSPSTSDISSSRYSRPTCEHVENAIPSSFEASSTKCIGTGFVHEDNVRSSASTKSSTECRPRATPEVLNVPRSISPTEPLPKVDIVLSSTRFISSSPESASSSDLKHSEYAPIEASSTILPLEAETPSIQRVELVDSIAILQSSVSPRKFQASETDPPLFSDEEQKHKTQPSIAAPISKSPLSMRVQANITENHPSIAAPASSSSGSYVAGEQLAQDADTKRITSLSLEVKPAIQIEVDNSCTIGEGASSASEPHNPGSDSELSLDRIQQNTTQATADACPSPISIVIGNGTDTRQTDAFGINPSHGFGPQMYASESPAVEDDATNLNESQDFESDAVVSVKGRQLDQTQPSPISSRGDLTIFYPGDDENPLHEDELVLQDDGRRDRHPALKMITFPLDSPSRPVQSPASISPVEPVTAATDASLDTNLDRALCETMRVPSTSRKAMLRQLPLDEDLNHSNHSIIFIPPDKWDEVLEFLKNNSEGTHHEPSALDTSSQNTDVEASSSVLVLKRLRSGREETQTLYFKDINYDDANDEALSCRRIVLPSQLKSLPFPIGQDPNACHKTLGRMDSREEPARITQSGETIVEFSPDQLVAQSHNQLLEPAEREVPSSTCMEDMSNSGERRLVATPNKHDYPKSVPNLTLPKQKISERVSERARDWRTDVVTEVEVKNSVSVSPPLQYSRVDHSDTINGTDDILKSSSPPRGSDSPTSASSPSQRQDKDSVSPALQEQKPVTSLSSQKQDPALGLLFLHPEGATLMSSSPPYKQNFVMSSSFSRRQDTASKSLASLRYDPTLSHSAAEPLETESRSSLPEPQDIALPASSLQEQVTVLSSPSPQSYGTPLTHMDPQNQKHTAISSHDADTQETMFEERENRSLMRMTSHGGSATEVEATNQSSNVPKQQNHGMHKYGDLSTAESFGSINNLVIEDLELMETYRQYQFDGRSNGNYGSSKVFELSITHDPVTPKKGSASEYGNIGVRLSEITEHNKSDNAARKVENLDPFEHFKARFNAVTLMLVWLVAIVDLCLETGAEFCNGQQLLQFAWLLCTLIRLFVKTGCKRMVKWGLNLTSRKAVSAAMSKTAQPTPPIHVECVSRESHSTPRSSLNLLARGTKRLGPFAALCWLYRMTKFILLLPMVLVNQSQIWLFSYESPIHNTTMLRGLASGFLHIMNRWIGLLAQFAILYIAFHVTRMAISESKLLTTIYTLIMHGQEMSLREDFWDGYWLDYIRWQVEMYIKRNVKVPLMV